MTVWEFNWLQFLVGAVVGQWAQSWPADLAVPGLSPA